MRRCMVCAHPLLWVEIPTMDMGDPPHKTRVYLTGKPQGVENHQHGLPPELEQHFVLDDYCLRFHFCPTCGRVERK